MKVLIVGNGGREAALVRKIFESPLVKKVFCAPGNAGTSAYATNVKIPVNDIPGLLEFAKQECIDLTIVGPEDPLTMGIVDVFKENGLAIFGPSKGAAILEGSKLFTKALLEKYDIPTAGYKRFYDPTSAEKYVVDQDFPVVIKANGLAAGKGVFICENLADAISAIQEIMVARKFGDAGECIIIEEFLRGEEASYIVLVDENGHVLPLASSQDHKRVGNDDTGLNTGGMGAYSPAPVVTAEIERRVLNEIIYPTVDAMIKEGRPFTGFLYAGLMIDRDGNPKVLEFNVRMGDPETQPLMMRMKSDLVPILLAALKGELDKCQIDWDPRKAVCVVMAANGYPGSYRKSLYIEGIDEVEQAGAKVYHAGTALNEQGELVSSGGRVLGVTALGETFVEAQHAAYQAVSGIRHDGLFYRDDIANHAIKK